MVVERGARIAKPPKYRVRLRTENIIPDGEENDQSGSSSDTHLICDYSMSLGDYELRAVEYERNISFWAGMTPYYCRSEFSESIFGAVDSEESQWAQD